MLIEITFWLLCFLIFYSYLGYGLLLWLILKLKRIIKPAPVPPPPGQYLPPVTLMVPAYNEEGFIAQKIANCLELDYPEHLLEIWFITDGSSDNTPAIVAQHPQVKLLHQPARAGKIAAMNRAMHLVQTPVAIFCDANTLLPKDALLLITRHFADPKVGCVAGEKTILQSEKENAAGSGEGIYWKYESRLKTWDSELYSVVGAAGELFALRTELFTEPEPDTLLDDFIISLRIAAQGYRVVYESKAMAMELPTASVEEELKRKVRICAGGIQSVVRLRQLLNPFRHGWLSFQYVSHRVLRWTVTPLALALVIPLNVWLAIDKGGIYKWVLAAQAAFYVMVALGAVLKDKRISLKGFYVPYYFFIMNLAVYLGFARYIKGNQSVLWEKARRAA